MSQEIEDFTMTITNKRTGLTVCNGAGKPVKLKRFATFDNNYELSALDKATVFITMLTIVLGIVYATFGG
jgi:hypothetical protein